MVNDFSIASGKDVNLFMRRHCRNEKARFNIAKYFKVEIEGYEALPPGHQVYGWINGGKLIGDTVMVFRVKDMCEMKVYYPVFPERIGKRLLKAWNLSLPPKWSIYADDHQWPSRHEMDALNREMRSLLIYSRLFIVWQKQVFFPMPYSFKEIYLQLNEFPGVTVDSSVINMVNDILHAHLAMETNITNCTNLQEFIVFVHNKYKMLALLEADFSGLRALLLKEGKESCF